MESDSRRPLAEGAHEPLSNAIKFTPAGGVVTISLKACGRHHTITLRDAGEGIEPGFLPFVFDHYRQAERADGTGGGLGLGLAIARHIVELHDEKSRRTAGGPEKARCSQSNPREPTPHPQGGGSLN
jgi:K+-sensing histidine kinase KdpD